MIRWEHLLKTSAMSLLLCYSSSSLAGTIARVWHGKTRNEQAAAYSRYLDSQIQSFNRIPGNRGFTLLREVVGNETHFMVISYWDSLEAVRRLTGNDIHAVHPLPRDAEFLLNPESTVMNYEIVDDKLGL